MKTYLLEILKNCQKHQRLRKRIQSIISEEDILEIELQDYARSILKESVEDQKERREYLYEIFEDEKINDFIKNKQIDDAKCYIDDLIGDCHDT